MAAEARVLHLLRRLLHGSRFTDSKATYISSRVAGKSVLDLGCVGHSLVVAHTKEGEWLHAAISRKARRCVGLDVLGAEVEQLRREGWDIIAQDITELHLAEKFETVVAADVIEHLSNFDAFFVSVAEHLDSDGELIISTPNALGLSHSLYVTLRGLPLVNPQHTCWFEPKTLIQLAGRYGFVPVDLAWIKRSWGVSHFLLHGTRCFGSFDFFTGMWSPVPTWKRLARAFLQRIVFFPVNIMSSLLVWRKFMSSDFVMVFKIQEVTRFEKTPHG